MRKIYRTLFLGTVILVLLTSACAEAPGQGTPFPTLSEEDLTGLPPAETSTSVLGTPETPVGTPQVGTTGTPLATQTSGTTGTPVVSTTGTAATGTAAIPVTGEDVVVMCEFCLEDIAHTILAVPEGTTFETTLSDASADADLTCYSVETTAGKQLVVCYGTALAAFTLNVCTADNNCVDVPATLMDCPAAGTGGATDTPTAAGTGTPTAGATTTPPVIGTPTATP